MKKFFLALALSIATSPIGSKAETIHLDSPTGHQRSAQHTISFNYGLSWIVSKVYDYRAYKNYRWRGGQELQTEYTCVFAQGLGFGLVGSFNWTEYPAAQITQLHIAPEFVFARDLGDHWRVKASAGLGLAYYNDPISPEASNTSSPATSALVPNSTPCRAITANPTTMITKSTASSGSTPWSA